MAKKWIAKAIRKPGIFRAKAKAMGVSTATLARRWAKKPGVWGKRARLAITLRKLPRAGRAARARGGRKAATTRRRR